MNVVAAKDPLDLVLRRINGSWRSVSEKVARLLHQLREAIGPQCIDELAPELRAHLIQLETASARLEQTSRHPEVIIAAAGTTSSGKSTLVNLLAGARLLPKGVQEISAGVATITHHPELCRLVIPDTRGASWTTGTWTPITCEGVYERLDATMKIYRERLRSEGMALRQSVAPPRFEITWPTRMGKDLTAFGLPRNARLILVDLPGFKYADDELNGSVVREQVRKALCLVAYNAAETNDRMQESLLRQVVEQVKDMGGTPARMMFLLNRIDVYRSDKDPVASERAFTERTTQQIRQRVREALPEHAEIASRISPLALSAEPALFAALAEDSGPADDHDLLDKLISQYSWLYSKDDRAALGGSVEQWTATQRHRCLGRAKQESRLDAFEQELADHIHRNYLEIVLPDPIDGVERSAGLVLQDLEALICTYGLQERAQLELELGELEALYEKLKALREAESEVTKPLRSALETDPQLETLRTGLNELGKKYQISEQLTALSRSALADLTKVLRELVEYTFQRATGEDREHLIIESSSELPALTAAIEKLRATPYGQTLHTGGSFEGEAATIVNEALRELAAAMTAMNSALMRREASALADRMVAALLVLGRVVVARLGHAASPMVAEAGYPGLRASFSAPLFITPPRFPLDRLLAAPGKEWERREQVREEQTVDVYQRSIRRLWLWKSHFTKQLEVERQVQRTGIDVPKLGDLLDSAIEDVVLREHDKIVVEWVTTCLNTLDRVLAEQLDQAVAIYRRAFLQKRDDLERGASRRIEGVEHQRSLLAEVLDDLGQLRNWRQLIEGRESI